MGNHEYGKKKKKKWRSDGFQDEYLGEIQELLVTTLEELTEDDLMEMNSFQTRARRRGSRLRRDSAENKLTSDT